MKNKTDGSKSHKRIKKLNRARRKMRRQQQRLFWQKICLMSYQRILAYTRKLADGDLCDAQDLAQGTVLRVLKYSKNPRNIADPVAYIRRVARNLWNDRVRQKDASLDDLLESNPNHPALIVPNDLVSTFEDREAFERKLGPLTPELIMTIRMRLEGYSWQEIAAVLNEKVSRTKFRWYGFLERLQDRVKRMRDEDENKDGDDDKDEDE